VKCGKIKTVVEIEKIAILGGVFSLRGKGVYRIVSRAVEPTFRACLWTEIARNSWCDKHWSWFP
jgi:hypothetical protein